MRGLGRLALVGLLALASPARGAGAKSPDTDADADADAPPNYPGTTLKRIPENAAPPPVPSDERIFPIGGAALRAQGFDIPRAFGVGIFVHSQGETMGISSLSVDGENISPLVLDPNSNIDTNIAILAARVDWLLFPFLDLFLLGGAWSGTNDVTFNPQVKEITGDISVGVDGPIFGAGATLAGGYEWVYATVTGTFVGTIEAGTGAFSRAWVASLLVGAQTPIVNPMVGAMYQGITQKLEGAFSTKTGIPEWLGPAKIGLDFEIELNQNAWNGQVGVYRSFGTHWEAALMVGFINRTYINMVAGFRFY